MNETWIWLCVTAFSAGAINSLAGGGTLLTFPALETALRLAGFANPGAVANATSTVALMPSTLSSAWAYRRELARTWRWLKLLVAPSLLGGLIGSVLVIRYPDQFDALVPWLILAASTLFLLQPLVARWLGKHHDSSKPTRWRLALVVLLQSLVAIYGGYFGAGIGILMLSALGLMGLSDMHEMNSLKVCLGACVNGMAVVVFVIQDLTGTDVIHWGYALAMMVCGIVGGYVGAKYGRLLPVKVVRGFVIAVGFGLTAYYFLK